MFSKSCEYGIKAIIYIATRSLEGERVKIGEVSKGINAPEAFTAKILTSLIKKKILESKKGPYGGFIIGIQRIAEIKVSEIVSAIDGEDIYIGCGLGLKECNSSQPCPMHDKFVKIREELREMLESTTILELATGLKSGKTLLIR
ncbi:RrF2 family transcriptional regulator [Cyclobacterium jeungdonense]|uniref:Rrf2 family transcriptional regulator n=1 Tax=Cyclobacterium jeungdonense TaxID=708087 RepID=A0ABT8C9S7_9BACT|nr:Rrf2 family transcriptional regulator [Cyclobacterium jeungdonense]MDN3688578.1 Rrf2 family transcriptional regulator [Cyclobacterium jeungdonense]